MQYLEYLRNMVTGHWGVSIGATLGEPVSTIVGQALPWTLGLVGVTTILAFLLGSLVGIVAGWRRGGRLDSILPSVFVVTSALPYFWVGAAADPGLLGLDERRAAQRLQLRQHPAARLVADVHRQRAAARACCRPRRS